MSDNRRVYRRIKTRLRQLYPRRLSGNQARHMNTLAMMVTGIVQSKQSHLEAMARHAPDGNKVGSREKKFARFTQNEPIDEATYFLPFLTTLLQRSASSGLLVLIMDASKTGRHCLTLMVSVVYYGRALSLAWQTIRGNKGPLSETVHLAILQQVQHLIPVQSDVIFLGGKELARGREQYLFLV